MIDCIPLADGALAAEREHDVTASIIGCLWGSHPWKTIFELYNEKRGLKFWRQPSPVMERGTELEMTVALKVQRAHPEWKIVKSDSYYRDPEARIGATPDYLIRDDPRGLGILQCKTVGSNMWRKTWADTNTPPLWIALQAQTEIMLTEASFGLVAVLVVGDYTWDLHEYEIPSHAAAQMRIRGEVAKFWHNFEQNIRPEPDYARDQALIEALHPHDKPGVAVDLRGDNRIIELLETIETAKDTIDAAELVRGRAEAEIKEKMGDAALALVRGWRVTWKNEERAGHYVPPKTRRVFRWRRTRCQQRLAPAMPSR